MSSQKIEITVDRNPDTAMVSRYHWELLERAGQVLIVTSPDSGYAQRMAWAFFRRRGKKVITTRLDKVRLQVKFFQPPLV